MAEHTRVVSVRMDDDLLEPLQALAEQDDRSVGYLMRTALRRYLASRGAISEKKAGATRR